MSIFVWYIIIQVLALSSFQYLFKIFRTTKDHGYAISKILGIIIIPYCMWVINIFHIAKYTYSNLIIITMLFCFSGILIGINQKRRLAKYFAAKKYYIIITELLFAGAYLFFLSIVAYSQYGQWGERNMDIGYIWALFKTTSLPPQDPWLCNVSINYYYFGHFIIASLSKLANIPPNISYTLSMGMLPALFIVICFAVVYEITSKMRYALLGAIILGFSGNNFLLFQLLQKGLLFPQNVLSQTARIIPYTVNEYPFISFILGEVHSHSIALPVNVALLYTIYKFFKDETLRYFRYKDCFLIMLIGFLLSIIYFIDILNFVIYLSLSIFTILLDFFFQVFTSVRERAHRNYVPPFIELQCAFNMFIIAILITLFAYVFFIPFGGYLNIEFLSMGIIKGSTNTSIIHLIVIFCLYLFTILIFAAVSFINIQKPQNRRETALYYLIVLLIAMLLIAFFNYLHIMSIPKFILILIIISLLSGFKKMIMITDKRLWFCCGLTLFGLIILLGCEVFFITMSTVISSDFYRSLTISRFHLQSLIIMGIVLPFLVSLIINKLKPYRLSLLFSIIFTVLLGIQLIYPIDGALQKALYFKETPSLDSSNFIATLFPSIHKAITWINGNIEEQVSMLESVGKIYSKWGMVSSYTGNPTLVQWPKHIYQQGYPSEEIAKRIIEADQIYRTDDFNLAYSILQKYNIKYVFIGEIEKERYSQNSLAKFSKYCKKIYDEDNNEIYILPTE